MTSNEILDEFRIMAGDDDVWGDVMTLWFTIAEGLHMYDPELVPAEWEFRPRPFLASVDLSDDDDRTRWIDDQSGMYGLIVADLLAADMPEPVLYAGRVITRYAALVKAAVRDY